MEEQVDPKVGAKLTLHVTDSPVEYSKGRSGAEERGAAFGLSPVRYLDAYSANQSFPCSAITSQQINRNMESPALHNARSQDHLANISGLTQGARGQRLFNNPLKGWAIIAEGSGEVLVSNNIFRQLLDVDSAAKIRLWDYVERKGSHCQETLDQLEVNPETGDTDRYNGQVVTLRVNEHNRISVSMTLRPLADSSRVLVFLETVNKTVGRLELDGEGLITHVDQGAEVVFQQKQAAVLGESIQALLPDIQLPGLEPGSAVKTACTGRTEDDLYFPVSVVLRRMELGSALEYSMDDLKPSISVSVWVYSSVSGLILLNDRGEIEDCDQSLSCLVLGYSAGQLAGQRIENVLPGFYDDFDLSSADRTEEDLGCEELSDTDRQSPLQADKCVPLAQSPLQDDKCVPLAPDDSSPLEEISMNVQGLQPYSPTRVVEERSPICRSEKENNLERSPQQLSPPPLFKRPAAIKTPVKIPMDMFTSTPAHSSADLSSPKQKLLSSRTPISSNRKPRMRAEQSIERSRHKLKDRNLFGESRSLEEGSCSLPTGCFYGLARHKNGTEISTLYQIKRVTLKSGATIYCVWVSRDSEDIAGRTQQHLTLAASAANETLGTNETLATTRTNETNHNESNLNGANNYSQNESSMPPCDISINSLVEGEFSDSYDVIKQIGRGAYGCVQSGYRKSDNLLVVVKFIYKNKVIQDNWVRGVGGQLIPFEVSLLSALSHDAIVRLMDVHQNTSVVQMVMEKHGDMDLFEFIDRNPVMDEALASYIFRQIVSGVDFLHSKSILHRDIKDENIIIDHRFRVKLIDFGSSTFFKAGDVFATFYGTVEYCAPEVLKGNHYDGQQVEVWALGILLFILMFGENPFYDVADTVRCELHPPHLDISQDVWGLIEAILEPEPSARASLWYIKEEAWVNQDCAIQEYRIQDIIGCSEDEINPATHYSPSTRLHPLDSQISANENSAEPREDCSTDINDYRMADSLVKISAAEQNSINSVSELGDMST